MGIILHNFVEFHCICHAEDSVVHSSPRPPGQLSGSLACIDLSPGCGLREVGVSLGSSGNLLISYEGKRGGETGFSKGREKEIELRQAFLPLLCPQFLAQSSTTSENALEGIFEEKCFPVKTSSPDTSYFTGLLRKQKQPG